MIEEQVNRRSPVPLYYQLKQILLSKIQTGEWSSGELIPSETQLIEDYSVSRTTVRQTLAELVTEGYLVRHRGRGTFISEPKITYDPSKQLELNEYMKSQGVTLAWQVMDQTWMAASERVAEMLNVASGANVLRVRRLRLAGERVIGYHVAFLPEFMRTFIDPSRLAEGQSLDYIMKHPGMARPRLQRTLEASLADDLDLAWLDVDAGSPILQLERVVATDEGLPLEFLLARFRGDRFKYQLTQ